MSLRDLRTRLSHYLPVGWEAAWPIPVAIIAALLVTFASPAKLQALASLAWPAVTGLALYWLMPDIRALLPRLRKGELLGLKFELGAELNVLKTRSVEVEAQYEAKSTSPPLLTARLAAVEEDDHIAATGEVQSAGDLKLTAAEPIDETITRLLQDATQQPRAALMLLSAKLEQITRELVDVADAGSRNSWRPRSLRESVRYLVRAELLIPEAGDTLRLFWSIRNKVSNDDEVLRALDSGTRLLRVLLIAKQSILLVNITNVPLFSDPECKTAARGRGVELELSDRSRSMCPTTRTHYRNGMYVTDDWDLNSVWDETWYRDPRTNEIRRAWRQAAEFVGRPIGIMDAPATTSY
jgi:hypothetical protein